MVKIGYHASHEQFSPSALLKYVQQAEKAGFQFVVSSDHFHPWNSEQGESGFAWSWLGAAMALTSMEYGVVNAPGGRYHPAIIAQAAATLEEMFEDRFWICTGSGQAINEAITGEKWPIKEDRNQRLKESVEVMRALWSGETVTHRGIVTVEQAKLYSRPKTPPPVIGAAITAKTARWLAGWADGLLTISQPLGKLQKVIDGWKEGGGENKPMKIKVQLSYDQSDELAGKGAHEQWRTNVFDSELSALFRTVSQLEMAAKNVTIEDVAEMVHISSEPQRHLDWILKYKDMGFTEIDLHNVNLKQEQFIDVFGERVLPEISRI